MYDNEIKFSLWCDFVERVFLEKEFSGLISQGIVNAATSNPSIFKAAFLGSKAYIDDRVELQSMAAKGIYEALAIKDIALAASRLLPSYEKGDDGFISIEVDPFLCDDAKATIEEGKRLFQAIGYPNVMIKVPATEAGFEAMEVLLSEGIHVNATLIFSEKQTQKCLEAFSKANDKLVAKGCVDLPKAVISIFVSRFDRKLDDELRRMCLPTAQVGIMNAMQCYMLIEKAKLQNVRALFASTGVKGDALGEDYYVKELFLPNAINTAPLATILAFTSSPKNNTPVEIDSSKIEAFFATIKANGIDMDSVCDELMSEGLVAFKDAFKEILDGLKP